MQDELDADHGDLNIEILGINGLNNHLGNGLATATVDVPWLQDVDSDNDGQSDVWGNLLAYDWRDVVILDSENEVVSVYNLTQNGLEDSENYEELKNIFISAADTEEPLNPWHNYDQPLDVNDDSFISPIDALFVLNELNTVGPHELDPTQMPTHYLDSNDDGFVSPIDALLVINHLNLESQEDNSVAAIPLTSQLEEDRSTQESKVGLSPALVDDVLSDEVESGPVVLDLVAETERAESRDLILLVSTDSVSTDSTEDLLNSI